MYECIECGYDISELVDWDTLLDDFIKCPKCLLKMTVEYSEVYDGENEHQYWWVEKYEQ